MLADLIMIKNGFRASAFQKPAHEINCMGPMREFLLPFLLLCEGHLLSPAIENRSSLEGAEIRVLSGEEGERVQDLKTEAQAGAGEDD